MSLSTRARIRFAVPVYSLLFIGCALGCTLLLLAATQAINWPRWSIPVLPLSNPGAPRYDYSCEEDHEQLAVCIDVKDGAWINGLRVPPIHRIANCAIYNGMLTEGKNDDCTINGEPLALFLAEARGQNVAHVDNTLDCYRAMLKDPTVTMCWISP